MSRAPGLGYRGSCVSRALGGCSSLSSQGRLLLNKGAGWGRPWGWEEAHLPAKVPERQGTGHQETQVQKDRCIPNGAFPERVLLGNLEVGDHRGLLKTLEAGPLATYSFGPFPLQTPSHLPPNQRCS